MDITEDLGPDDMMVHQMTQPILMSDRAMAVRGAASGPGSGELGRRLLLAARHGDTQLVLDLLAKGAPFTTDWLGTSALHAAAGGGHAGTCAVLLRAGVSRDCRTKVERTPLHLAAHAGHAAAAALLLQHGAAPDCRDSLRMTPLHWAADRGHADAAALLLRRGADPHALSKFNKTPLSLAAARGHRRIVKLIEDALEEREAADSVESLKVANETEGTDPQQTIDPLERLQEAARQTIEQSAQPEPIKINIEKPLEPGGGGGGGGGQAAAAAAAAAMLRRHGIALLPRDEGSTVLSALQSGRSVVLSDAGKLMLKESSEIPHVVKSTPAPTPAAASASKGVVLTATPIKSPPKQSVKIFTLNNKLLAMPKENKAPIKKIINPHDSMQIQYIKLPSDAKITAAKSISMKAKNKLNPAGPAAALSRPTVKLMMQKANFNKLIASPENTFETPGPTPAERNVLFVPEEFLTNTCPNYLRSQLLSAHRTIASLNAQLNRTKARLANYENP